MNGYWKGVLFSFVGAVVLPLLLGLQLQVNDQRLDPAPLLWMAGSLFCTFLIGWLAGLVHLPSGELVGTAPPPYAPTELRIGQAPTDGGDTATKTADPASAPDAPRPPTEPAA